MLEKMPNLMRPASKEAINSAPPTKKGSMFRAFSLKEVL